MSETFNDQLSLIQFRIREEGDDPDISSATLWIIGKEAIRMIHRILVAAQSDLVQTTGTVALADQTTEYSTSGLSNFLAPVKDGVYISGVSDPLKPMTEDRLQQYTTSDQGTPEEFMIRGSTLYVRPHSDSVITLNMNYFQVVSAYMPSASNQALPWSDLFNDAIIFWVVEAALGRKQIYDTSAEKGIFQTIVAMVLTALKERGGNYKIPEQARQ